MSTFKKACKAKTKAFMKKDCKIAECVATKLSIRHSVASHEVLTKIIK